MTKDTLHAFLQDKNYRMICQVGLDEAKALVNIFECMMLNENGYDDVDGLLDYRFDNLLANIEQVQQQLERFVERKKEQEFEARMLKTAWRCDQTEQRINERNRSRAS